MDDLYSTDIYAWSQRQAAVLRDLASRPGLPNELDLQHVAEEIEDVGGSQRVAVESFIRLIFVHLMKAASAQSHHPKLHWRGEVIGFHSELVGRFTRSMQKDIDLDLLWKRAAKQASADLEEHGEGLSPLLVPECPFEFGDLVVEDLRLNDLLARVRQPESE